MTPPLVEETIVRLNVNGVSRLQWRCTPADLEALAIGRLYIDGAITTADGAHIIIEPARGGEIVINARIDDREVVRGRPPERGLPFPDGESFAQLFRVLFSTVDARHEHGGMHAAAATDGERIVAQVEDVGRHNTIDKITGLLLLGGLQPHHYGLLTSARVSGEIADKAARAGFAWLASRSIPTSLAVQFAADAHMPIIGRAAGKSACVYQ